MESMQRLKVLTNAEVEKPMPPARSKGKFPKVHKTCRARMQLILFSDFVVC